MKTAGLEIGGEAEVMEVTKATRNALSHLEETVNGFDRGIRQAGFQVGQDAVEMFFESSREFAERFEPRTVGPAQPPADGKQVAIGQYSLESLAQGDGAAQEPVDVGKSLGALQGMVKSVASQSGYLTDEFPVESLPPTKF